MADLPWIDEDKLILEQPKLYHYTTATALPKILSSKGMFATSFGLTNDLMEARVAALPLSRKMVEAAFPRMLALAQSQGQGLAMSEAESKARMLEAAKDFYVKLLKSAPTPPHITCFSAHTAPHHDTNGLLTMWRLYGAHREKDKRRWRKQNEGQGVALGFSTKKLSEATERIRDTCGVSSIHLDRVYYGGDDLELNRRVDEAGPIADLFADYFIEMIVKRNDDWDPNMRVAVANMFLVLAPSAKHADFIDERETRLVVCEHVDGTLNGRTPFAGPSGRLVVQYLEALEDVIVGPSNRQGRLFKRVRRLLDVNGLEHIPIRKSETPFRHL